MTRSILGLLVLTLVACGSDEESAGLDFGAPPDGALPDEGPEDLASMDAATDGGTGGTTPFELPPSPCGEGDEELSPELLAPVMGTVEDGPFIFATPLPVRCRVPDRGVETVTLRRLVAPGARVPREPPVANTGDTWEATFDLSEAQNGFVAFECQAEGRTPAGEPTCGVSRVTTWLDLGPELTLVRPEEETFLRDRLSLAWDVVPLPLTSDPGEAGAQIAEVQLRVAGADITSGIESAPSEEDGRPGALRYTADVDLNDATLFPSGLDGRQQLLVRVTNARGASREALRAFNIDEEGPDITFLTPDEGALVGGLVTVRIEATDPAGVDATSLQLRVADRVFDFRPVDGVANEYTSSFNAADFPDDPSVILSVTARDGNATPNTASRTVRLDSAPPIAALDPVDVRAVRETSRDVQCSVLFDPVGSDSVDDGEIVLSQGEFRARVEDVGNVTLGDGVVTFVSGVRSVELYIFQPTDADPRSLLVDTNGDDLCDDISSEVLPVPGVMDPAELVVLGGVRPTGAPRGDELDFSGAGVPASAYADGAIYADCTEENGSETPRLLCDESSPLSMVISSLPDSRDPAIFAVPPISGANCVGSPVNLSRVVRAGRFACAAVRVEDNLGNVSVSPPIRFCVDDGSDGCGGALGTVITDEEVLPDCTADSCMTPVTFRDLPRYQRVDP